MGNAKNRQRKKKRGSTRRRQVRTPRIPKCIGPGSQEGLEIIRGYQCRKCPHHPFLMTEDLAGHKDLHKIQKTLRPSNFAEVVRIPANHPMMGVASRRFMKHKISRTGASYYLMTNPIVLSRRMEHDPLVRERYNEALQRQNGQNSTRRIDIVDTSEEVDRSNEEPPTSVRASTSRKTRSSSRGKSCAVCTMS